jgi:serine/threonine-protein kinase RsbW
VTDILAHNAVRLPATPEAVDAVHGQLERLWEQADFVPDLDRMAFETAVVEAASNAVRHAVAEEGAVVEVGVEATVTRSRLVARICEYGAVVPDPDPTVIASVEADDLPDDSAESGRGMALIRALVTTLSFERHEGTNIWTLTRDADGEARE